ncbi:MAG: efflux RND transporter permease subunit [Tissierella sp.]|uniref:efflux RND transporter permease subunit n=1 Tax=Tissierella sp. TaxID=41274 RepID=UPI003F98AAF7
MLSKFSVKKPYTIVVAVIIVLILGTISFVNLQTDLLPSLDLPFLVINTSYPGASPEEVEMVVTRPIEQIVARANNIKDINSISSENSSTVIMEFDNDVNMDSAIIEINGNLDLIKGAWDDAVGSPMIIRLNPDMLPIMVSSVDVSNMDISEISTLVKEDIIPELESVSGVAAVDGTGLIEENIDVVLNENKIEKLNKNILNKLDKELSDVGNDLNSAKREIENGKSKLESEENKQLNKLETAEDGIKEGKNQLNEGKAQIDEGIRELKNKRAELLASKKEIEKKEKELLNIKNSFGDVENVESVEGIEDIEGINEILNPEQTSKLEDTLKGLVEMQKGKEEIENGLIVIDENIKELEEKRRGITNQAVDLNFKEQDIATGKVVLSKEMDKAKDELETGERELDKNIKEFEEKREEAFKGASLEGVIDKDMVSGILMAQNFSMPAGYLGESGKLVKVGDKLESIDEIKDLLLFDTGEDAVGKVFLNDVGDVKFKDNSDEIYAKVNGNNAVILNFQKQSNYSTSEVSNNLKDKMNEITDKNESLSFSNLMDQGVYIDIVVKSVLQNIVYGGILAILILMLFLRDIKPTFIIAVSIPISVVFAIAMMYFTGVTINIISLAGLALGVGMLVDNSIVVIENIYRLKSEGMSSIEASMTGAREVSGAIMASTLTTACVFLPIVFTKGISRQLFADMGLTIAYSLFASLIVALTLVPTMSSTMLKDTKEKKKNIFDRFTNSYTKVLEGALNHKALIMLGVSLLLVISGYLAYNIGTSFIPSMESPQMDASLTMPKDSTFEETVDMTNKVIEKLIDIDGVETIGAFQNGAIDGGLGAGSPDNLNISLYILLDEDQKIDNTKISKDIERETKDLDVDIVVNSSNMDMTALGGSGIEVVVKGRELDSLKEISEDVESILDKTDGIENIERGSGEGTEEIRIKVNKEKAMEKGFTTAEIFSEINNILEEGKQATELTVNNKDFPVIVIEDKSLLLNKDSLLKLQIENKDEEVIKLEDIVQIDEQKGVASINRKLQQRNISVHGDLKEDYNIGLVSRDLEKGLDNYNVPEGYSVNITGENEMINDSLRDISLMLLLSIVFIYLIMVAEFQSLLSPFIVMFTIPLAFTGGFLALWATGNDISLIAMLGFLVLSGIVVNNGIVFVDYTNQLRQRGMKKKEALIFAGRTRLRPIFMTAITTILGLSTLSIGVGAGSEMLQPLAIVAIGGLIYSTILTLIVVPVMYDLLNKKELSTRGELKDE